MQTTIYIQARKFSNSSKVLNSPVDGKLLYLGKVQKKNNNQIKKSVNPQLEQVKVIVRELKQGIHFSLKDFLGFIPSTQKSLYYFIIYLSPSDYHRVHVPFDFNVTSCDHYPGFLFSVHPRLANKVQGLFSLNERVVILHVIVGITWQLRERILFSFFGWSQWSWINRYQ